MKSDWQSNYWANVEKRKQEQEKLQRYQVYIWSTILLLILISVVIS